MIIGESLSITILHANYATEEVPQIYIRSRKGTVPEGVIITFNEQQETTLIKISADDSSLGG